MSAADDLLKSVVEGSGGKGGGGGHTAVEDPNTLRSRALVRVVDLISEGEIVGLSTGDERSIFFNDTPVKSSDGSYNFSNVTYATRVGLPSQSYIPGFAQVETERTVNAPVTAASSIIRSVSNAAADAARVTISWPAGMAEADTKNGDIKGSSVGIAIDVKLATSGSWINALTTTVSGKCMSAYEKAWRIERPVGAGFWDIRVRRTSPDATQSSIRNSIAFARYTEIIDERVTYNYSAVIGVAVDAESTGGQIPTRSYLVKGVKVLVPNNYNPVSRTYSGVWNGGFGPAQYTNNPAWILYDLLTNDRYGMGEYIKPEMIDRYSFYDASVYNDAFVLDGLGSTEPRFTFNGVIQAREEAIKVLQAVASCMRATLVYHGGLLRINQDRPSSVVKTITNSNVIDGLFTYASSSLIQRNTVCNVTFSDKNDKWLPRVITETTDFQIPRYGYNTVELNAFGCTSEGQARRLARWHLYTNLNQTEAVIWRASFNQQELNVGDVVNVTDSFWGGTRSFRVMALTLEEANIVKVEAVQYIVGKYTVVEQLPTNPGTGPRPPPTDEVEPVTNVRWTPEVVTVDGEVQSRSLRVEWDKPTAGMPTGYRFKWRRNNDNYTAVPDQNALAFTIPNAVDGTYQAIITAFNAKGVVSPLVTSTYVYSTSNLTAGTSALAAPINFFIRDTTSRIWGGEDMALEWTNPTSNAPTTPESPIVKDFELKIYPGSGGGVLRTEIISGVQPGSKAYFSYTSAMNKADGGLRRDLYCEVRCRDATGKTSAAASGTFTNQSISSIPITGNNVFPAIGGYKVTYTYPTDYDFRGVLIWADTTPLFTPSSANLRYQGTDSVANITGVPEGTVWYFRIAAYDSFNNPPSLAGTGLNIFPAVGAPGIGPVSPAVIANAIPTGATLPATGTEGQLFFLTTDGLLYRRHNGVWTAHLTFAEIDGSLSGAQQAQINLANLTGQIRNTQIQNNSISTPLLQAGAVQTANLAAGAVVAGTIAAGAITGDKIQANSIATNHIQSQAIDASKIQANSITAGMIQAGQITADKVAFRTLSANQIATNTIAADSAFLGALQVDSLQIGGNAVTVPFAMSAGAQDISNQAVYLFHGQMMQQYLNVQAQIIYVHATFELWEYTGSGAMFDIQCELYTNNSLTATSNFTIGVINNNPKFSQSAAFAFTPVGPGWIGVRFRSTQLDGGGGHQVTRQLAFAMAGKR